MRQLPLPCIPEEILLEIIIRLPLKSIARFKLTSKQWNITLSDPKFIHEHNKRGTFDDQLLFYKSQPTHVPDYGFPFPFVNQPPPNDSIYNIGYAKRFCKLKAPYERRLNYVLGSCNGLILLTHDEHSSHNFTVWNPLTKKSTQFNSCWENSLPQFRQTKYHRAILSALCYNASRDEYIIFLAFEPKNFTSFYGFTKLVVSVISCKTGRFTSPQYQLPGLHGFFSDQAGTIVCGNPHWLLIETSIFSISHKSKVIYFDVEVEKMVYMTLPEFEAKRKKLVGIGGLNRQTQLGIVLHNIEQLSFEVWVMKEYGKVESWTNLYTISHHYITKELEVLHLLGFVHTGEILLDVNRIQLLLYDPVKESIRPTNLWCRRSDFQVIAYQPSFIAPPQQCSPAQREILRLSRVSDHSQPPRDSILFFP